MLVLFLVSVQSGLGYLPPGSGGLEIRTRGVVVRSSLAEQLTELRHDELRHEEASKKVVKKENATTMDLTSVAATVAAISALGMVLPTETLEMAALAAVSAGYAASRNDTGVGELVRALGRLGESTVRKGLETAFGEPEVATKPTVVEVTKPMPVPFVMPPTTTTTTTTPVVVDERKRPPKRPLRARDASVERAAARRELDQVDAEERDLRRSETQLRAALAARHTHLTIDESQLTTLSQALDGIAVVRSTFRASQAMTPAAERELQALEAQLRQRQADVRALQYDADPYAARARVVSALSAIQFDLDNLARRRAYARSRLARASIVVVG